MQQQICIVQQGGEDFNTIGGAEDVHAQVTTTTSLRMSGDGARKLAIVAEEGQATLDGGGGVTILRNAGADMALANLVLRNGGPYQNGVASRLFSNTWLACKARPCD